MMERLEVQPNARSQPSFPAAGDVPAERKRLAVKYSGAFTSTRTGPCLAASADATSASRR